MLDVTTWAIVRGHEVFRDDADPDLFWVLPARLELARDPEGGPQLSLIVYRGDDSRGGMLTATFQLGLTPDELHLVADDLRRMLGRVARVQALEPARARLSLGPDDVLLGEGPPSPIGSVVINAALSPELAAAAHRALEGGEPLHVRARVSIPGRRPAMDGTVTMDLARAHEHVQGLGDAPIDATALRGALGELLEQGAIRLEARSPSTRVIDAAQVLLVDALLEPVASQRWRPSTRDDELAMIQLGLGQAADVTLRRAWAADLGELLGPRATAAVREVDLSADAFFATRELAIEVLGDFEAHQLHALVVEVRADGELKTHLFEGPGRETMRFRGRPSLELRTRAVPRSRGDVLGARGELVSQWRPVGDELVLLIVDGLAPLWSVELQAGAVDWGHHTHVEVKLGYGEERRSTLLTEHTPRATVWIRPTDPEQHAVELAVRYLGPGGIVERTIAAEAPGLVVIGPPERE